MYFYFIKKLQCSFQDLNRLSLIIIIHVFISFIDHQNYLILSCYYVLKYVVNRVYQEPLILKTLVQLSQMVKLHDQIICQICLSYQMLNFLDSPLKNSFIQLQPSLFRRRFVLCYLSYYSNRHYAQQQNCDCLLRRHQLSFQCSLSLIVMVSMNYEVVLFGDLQICESSYCCSEGYFHFGDCCYFHRQ